MKALRRLFTVVDKPSRRQTAIEKTLELQRLSGDGKPPHVFLNAFVHQPLAGTASEARELKQLILQQRKDWLAQQLPTESEHIDYDCVWEKDLAGFIEESAEVRRASLVIKSINNRDRSGSLIHKPLDWEFLRRCPVPLLMCSNVPQRYRRNIVAALDLRNESAAHKKLNDKVLATAAFFARLYGLNLHCVFAIEYSEVLADLDLLDVHKHERKVAKAILPQFKALVKPYGVPAKNLHLPLGRVGTAVNQVASKLHAKYLVVGTTARRNARTLLIGDSAAHVLSKTRRDLIAVKP